MTTTNLGLMLRCATLLSSLVACVPPNGQYGQSGQYQQQQYQQQQYQQSSSYGDDEYGAGENGAGQNGGGQNGGGSGRMWYCRAEATTVYGRGIDIMNKGRTRDDAALAALKDCGSLAGMSDVNNEGNEQRPVSASECEISSCWYAD
jgi:hypothetical protein